MWCGSSRSRLSRNWIAQIHDESEDAAAYSPVRRVSDKLRRTGAMRCGMAMAKGAGIFARSIIRRAAVFSGLARRGGISGTRCADELRRSVAWVLHRNGYPNARVESGATPDAVVITTAPDLGDPGDQRW